MNPIYWNDDRVRELLADRVTAPVYSERILGPDGKPALLGYTPVVAEAIDEMTFRIPITQRVKFTEGAERQVARIDDVGPTYHNIRRADW